ncbi:MAG TPA: L-fucose/L-arabinose isomerase family protein [Edaphobacter sp.]
MTFGVIVGNRGFFPSHLAATGRTEMVAAIERQGHKAVVTAPEQTAFGAVETYNEAKICAELFQGHAKEIDGIIVTLPNFGEERGIADAIRLANLKVPILIQATPDDAGKMGIAYRRDSFCGKMSICNNLRQYGVPYTLTTLHTEAPDSETFEQDLKDFAATCRIVRGFRNLRIGAIGARPAAFNTVRYSEKLLERSGITVDTLDLSEVMGRIQRLGDTEDAVVEKLNAIKSYLPVNQTPEQALLKMSKLGVVIDGWMKTNSLDVTSVQCWTSMEEFFGIVPCTVMSMMSEKLLPSACEVDTMGTVSMHALTLASETPSALLDWNNNYGTNPDKAVCFHCSNLPKHFFREGVKMDFQQIIAGTVGKENTYGTLDGTVKAGPMSFVRFSTDEFDGTIKGYVGQGAFTDDPLQTFGGAGVVEIPQMQRLLHYICENGFEHHVAANFSHVAGAVKESAQKYLGWPMHLHN